MKVSRFITTISLTTFLSICSVHSSSIHFFSIRGAEAQATVTVRNDYVWIDMPQTGNQNDNWSCGPTSAARVINFYGHNVNRDTLVGAVDREFILPSRIEKPWGGHVDIRTGTTPHVLRDVMKRWEGNNVKLERKADFNRLLGLLRQGKPVVVLLRVGSLRPLGPISGTWPEMHWVTVHGFSESEQKIYYTETNGETDSYSYNEFQSKWNWRVGDGLANESIRANGVEQRTMIWVDRVPDVVADANIPQSSQANTVPSGLYRKPNGTIVSANDNGAFCSFVSPAHFEFLSGRYDLVKPVTTGNISAMEDHGPCAVRLSPGVYRLEDGRIINSNGKAYCRYTSFDHYKRIDGRPIQQIEGDVPLFAMENHNNCPESW